MQACFADIEQTQEHYLGHALVLQPFFKKDSCFPYKRSQPHAWSLTLWTGQVMIFPPPNYLSSEITSLWFLRLLLLWKYHLAPKAMVRKLHWITARECHGQDISGNHHCLVQRSVFRRFHCRWFPSKLIPDVASHLKRLGCGTLTDVQMRPREILLPAELRCWNSPTSGTFLHFELEILLKTAEIVHPCHPNSSFPPSQGTHRLNRSNIFHQTLRWLLWAQEGYTIPPPTIVVGCFGGRKKTQFLQFKIWRFSGSES